MAILQRLKMMMSHASGVVGSHVQKQSSLPISQSSLLIRQVSMFYTRNNMLDCWFSKLFLLLLVIGFLISKKYKCLSIISVQTIFVILIVQSMALFEVAVFTQSQPLILRELMFCGIFVVSQFLYAFLCLDENRQDACSLQMLR